MGMESTEVTLILDAIRASESNITRRVDAIAHVQETHSVAIATLQAQSSAPCINLRKILAWCGIGVGCGGAYSAPWIYEAIVNSLNK